MLRIHFSHCNSDMVLSKDLFPLNGLRKVAASSVIYISVSLVVCVFFLRYGSGKDQPELQNDESKDNVT